MGRPELRHNIGTVRITKQSLTDASPWIVTVFSLLGPVPRVLKNCDKGGSGYNLLGAQSLRPIIYGAAMHGPMQSFTEARTWPAAGASRGKVNPRFGRIASLRSWRPSDRSRRTQPAGATLLSTGPRLWGASTQGKRIRGWPAGGQQPTSERNGVSPGWAAGIRTARRNLKPFLPSKGGFTCHTWPSTLRASCSCRARSPALR